MGYVTKVQVIQRAKGQQQFYLICPAPLAQALEMKKGETIEWVVEDKWTLSVRRVDARAAQPQRRSHAKG
jgi:antitoxin component of MazEF toxin-antitoxin module